MIEAQITCLCSMIRLADLGLVLMKGQVVYTDAQRAKSSKDLDVAAKANGVAVRYIERCQERVGDSRMSSLPENHPPPASKFIPPPEPEPEPEVLDLDALTAKMKEGLCSREDVERIVQMQVQKAVEALMGPLAGLKDLNASLHQAVEGLKNAPSRPFSGTVQEGEVPVATYDPRFIPDGLVSGLQGEVNVKEDKFEGEEVDAASKALRKMRMQKKGGKP